MKTFGIAFLLLIFVFGCASTPCQIQELSVDEAIRQFKENKWRLVECIGIPKEVPGFFISRYNDNPRVDLETKSKVYVIYTEFIPDSEGRFFRNTGRLVSLDGEHGAIFRFDSMVALDSENYVDIVGFTKDRMFRIHAWQKPRATENELKVALKVAKLAIETIKTSNQASQAIGAQSAPQPER